MAKKKKKRTWVPAGSGFGKKSFDSEFRKAEARMVREQWDEAYHILTDLSEQYPNEKNVWGYLSTACLELDDAIGFQRACEHLRELDPNNGDVLVGLGFSYMANAHPLLALDTFRHALKTNLDSEQILDIEKQFPLLERAEQDFKASYLEDIGEQQDDNWWEIALLHERGQAYLEEQEYDRARAAEQAVLKHQPKFLAAKNNLSLIDWAEGDVDGAIAVAKSVLENDPNNVHALSNVVRFLAQQGKDDQAQPYAAQLKAATDSNAWKDFTKRVEGLSYLGDDAGVVDIYEQWQALDDSEQSEDALFHHLVAVALARSDRLKEAKAQWKLALDRSPEMAIAQQNLDNLRCPAGDQSGPWPFSFPSWLSPSTLKDFENCLAAIHNSPKYDKMENLFQQFLAEHPHVMQQAPKLLERGSPDGQQFFVLLAEQIHEPDFMAHIKDFALGKNGPDRLRHKAAMLAVEAGILERNANVKMWVQGKHQDILLMAYQLSGEPKDAHHSKKVAGWQQQSVKLLQSGTFADAYKAESLLQKALNEEPDAPDLLTNLAASYSLQDRDEEAEAQLRDIHQRFPDYFFGRVAVAEFHIRDGNLEAAETLLQPLRDREKFHYSEFMQLMEAQLELELAKKNRPGAELWLAMWRQAMPSHPDLPFWQDEVDGLKG